MIGRLHVQEFSSRVTACGAGVEGFKLSRNRPVERCSYLSPP